jgi:5-methyltetrahydrofolate--homocysteine methyltransferase
MDTCALLNQIASERIIILDGAMGSMIQALHQGPVGTCNDMLAITKPELITGIHEAYLEAGADIIETCSFNSTSISLKDFNLEDKAYEISKAAAAVAKKAADKFSTLQKPRFVAGSMGPTAKSASITQDMDNPSNRAVTWDELDAAY